MIPIPQPIPDFRIPKKLGSDSNSSIYVILISIPFPTNTSEIYAIYGNYVMEYMYDYWLYVRMIDSQFEEICKKKHNPQYSSKKAAW